jgi:adenosylhomocysteine nucleosidase
LKVKMLVVLLACLGFSAGPAQSAGSVSDRILVLYAFDTEGETLAKLMTITRQDTLLGHSVIEGTIAGKSIVLAESGEGMTNAAMTTQMIIERFHPRVILFTGIAGAVDTSVHIGDIVVPSTWREHDYGYYGKDGLIPKGVEVRLPGSDSIVHQESFPVDSGLLAVARGIVTDSLNLDLINGRRPRLTVGGVGVTGNQFIDNIDERHWQTKHFQALTTDMESCAVAQVASVNGIPFLIFRSASDLAGGSGSSTARSEISQFFKVAAQNSTAVIVRFLQLMN